MGYLSGLLGVGGGFILVPLLIAIGIPTYQAIGSSLVFILFTGLSSVMQHRRYRNCDFRLALPVLIGSILTAQIGAYLTNYFEEEWLQIALSIVLIITAIIMIIDIRATNVQNNIPHVKKSNFATLIALTIGLTSGFFSGLLGVGGGFILVPLLFMFLNIPLHLAIGTSTIAVVGAAASGTIGHLFMGNINFSLVLTLTISGIILAPIGAKICNSCEQGVLKIIFSVVLILTAISLIAFR